VKIVDEARSPETDLAELEVRLHEAIAERDLARGARRNAEAEIRRLRQELTLSKLDLAAVRERLNERETYVRNLHGSASWKALQWLRGLFGRRW
jgi:chromosome segregation ATPase